MIESPPQKPCSGRDVSSLAKLSRTCKHLHHIISPILYGDLNLGTVLPCMLPCSVVLTLEQNPHLRNLVRSIDIALEGVSLYGPYMESYPTASPLALYKLFDEKGIFHSDLVRYGDPRNLHAIASRHIKEIWYSLADVGPYWSVQLEYAIFLTILLIPIQSTLTRASIWIPRGFWVLDKRPDQEICGIVLTQLPTFTHLTHLTLGGWNIEDGPLSNFLALAPNLKTLVLYMCDTHHPLESSYPKGLASLTFDHFNIPNISGNLVRLMKSCTELASFTAIRDNLPAYFSGPDGGLCGHLDGLYVQVDTQAISAEELALSNVRYPSTVYKPIKFSTVVSTNPITGVFNALVPASSTLKVLDLGGLLVYDKDWYPPGKDFGKPIKVTKFPNLDCLSVDCTDLILDRNENALVDLANYCPNLRYLILASLDIYGVDDVTTALFTFATWIAENKDSCARLEKIMLFCEHPLSQLETLVRGLYGPWFTASNIELVMMVSINWVPMEARRR